MQLLESMFMILEFDRDRVIHQKKKKAGSLIIYHN